MLAARLFHLQNLIERSRGPGRMYPVFTLAMRAPEDERAEMSSCIARTPLGPAWEVWRDPERTGADRAFALRDCDPAFGPIHLMVADLALRSGDPGDAHPELLAAICAGRPQLGAAYRSLLGRLRQKLEEESRAAELDAGNCCVAVRGTLDFAASTAEAVRLFTASEEIATFGRAALAWARHEPPNFVRALLPVEFAERWFGHETGAVSAHLTSEEVVAVECPDLVTSLSVSGAGAAAAFEHLRGWRGLRALTLSSEEPLGEDAGLAVAALPLESLSVSLPAAAPFPRWALAPSLRELSFELRSPQGSDAVVDVPAFLGAFQGIERLRLIGIRTLPDDLRRLVELRSLTVEGWHLVEIPASVAELPKLVRLHVRHVLALHCLPTGFETLLALRELRLGILATRRPPDALMNMPWLRTLDIFSAYRWTSSDEDRLRAALGSTEIRIEYAWNAPL